MAKLCGYDPGSVKDDGVFWMQLQSFEKLYDCVMILRLPKIEGQTLKAEEAAEEVGRGGHQQLRCALSGCSE